MIRPELRRSLLRTFQDISRRHHLWEVFNDVITCAALSVSNAVDLRQRGEREAEYMRIVQRYEREELHRFPQVLSLLLEALEEGPDDVLGELFGALELGNAARGQFFTPYELCKAMAGLAVSKDGIAELIAERGYVSLQEPACGAGAMVIGFAEAMRGHGFNPQQQLHVTAIDVDRRAALMCYLQLSLLHIPAVVVVGNTITLEVREQWFTPAHILGGWTFRLRAGDRAAGAAAKRAEAAGSADEPADPAFAHEQLQLSLFGEARAA